MMVVAGVLVLLVMVGLLAVRRLPETVIIWAAWGGVAGCALVVAGLAVQLWRAMM